MDFKFGERSKLRMEGIHPDLIAVMELAIQRTPIDFTVLEGLRTLDRQKQLVAKGASKTMNSRHLTGHAIDVAPLDGKSVSWDWPLYHKLAPVIKGAADDLGVDLEWGGDWRSFKDGPHWQLSWESYGKHDMKPRATLNSQLTEKVPSREAAPLVLKQEVQAERVPAPAKAIKVKDKGRSSIWQSSTIRAQLAQWSATFGGGGLAFWNAQDDATRYIIAGVVCVAVLAGAIVFKERIRKWIEGDR